MGIKQNLKLWENQLSYLDENGITVTQKLSRTIPQTPYTLLRLLSASSGVFFSLESNVSAPFLLQRYIDLFQIVLQGQLMATISMQSILLLQIWRVPFTKVKRQ